MNKGDRFEYTFNVSPRIYEGFKDIFNDNNPLHTDILFAKKFGFSSVVMHGNILGGFISFFIGECLPVKNVIIHSQSINYYSPVYLHDNLQFAAVVADVFESVNTIEFEYIFKNQNNKRVAKGKVQIGSLQ